MRLTLLLAAAWAVIFVTACSGGDASAVDPSSTAAPAQPTVSASPTAVPATDISSYTLVHVDTARGQGADIVVAAHDGSSPRVVANLAGFRRPLGVAGKTLAGAADAQVIFVDLVNGQTRSIPVQGIVFDGRFVDDATFVYSTSQGCAGGDAQNQLFRVDVATLQQTPLMTQSLSMGIVGLDAERGAVAIVSRGCDVGVNGITLISLSDGRELQRFAAEGCGWAVMAPAQSKAAVSWQSCTPPANHADADATIYDYGIVGPAGRDVSVPDSGATSHTWLPRPSSAEAALTTTIQAGTGPGSTRSGGVYLVDMASLAFRRVVPPEGAEQFAVQWTPDGRYLLYGIVEAQGLCRYGYLDLAAAVPQPRPIDGGIRGCGPNGQAVGWTVLR